MNLKPELTVYCNATLPVNNVDNSRGNSLLFIVQDSLERYGDIIGEPVVEATVTKTALTKRSRSFSS